MTLSPQPLNPKALSPKPSTAQELETINPKLAELLQFREQPLGFRV